MSAIDSPDGLCEACRRLPAGVTIHLVNGKRIRLIDLEDSARFAREVRRGMLGTPRRS